MSFFQPQNPGIDRINEFTAAEEIFLSALAAVPWTENSVPFINSLGLFTQDNPNFTYTDSTDTLDAVNITKNGNAVATEIFAIAMAAAL